MPELIATLHPYRAALPALLVAFGLAALARLLRRPALGAAANGAGALAGWWFAFGLLTASPRQLPERLPLLLLVLVLFTPPLVLLARQRPWLALPGCALGAAWAGWWMAGGPVTLPDLTRAAMVAGGVAAATLLLALRGWPRWAGPVAAGVLLAGLVAAAVPGPPIPLALVLLAAAVGAALVPPGKGKPGGPAAPAALPLAGALAGLAALPLLARGTPADALAAAAPLAALWLGAPLGAAFAGRAGPPLAALLAGAACAAAAFVLR